MSRRGRAALLGVIGSLGVFWVGCNHVDQDTYGPGRDLRRPPKVGPAPAMLGATALATHADFDRVEAQFVARASLPELLELYNAVLVRRPDDPLLLMRTALLVVEGPGASRSLARAFGLSDRLRQVAPDAADTEYLRIALERVVVRDPMTGAFFVPAGQESIARQLEEHLRAFIQANPTYHGPHGATVAELQKELDTLRAVIAGLTPDAEPTGKVKRVAPLTGDDLELWKHALDFYTVHETVGRVAACEEAGAALARRSIPELEELTRARCPDLVPARREGR